VGDVALVAERDHHRAPQAGDLRRGEAARGRRGAEAETGQGRNHHGECVGGIAPVSRRVTEWADHVEMLQHRAGPAVGEHQRQWIGAHTVPHEDVQGLAVDGHAPLIRSVEPLLQRRRTSGSPVVQQ
jgi:hypothetical protein